MTIREKLLKEIQSSPDNLLEQTLNFLRFLKTQETGKNDEEKSIISTGKNLVEHIKELGTWSGDDLEECLKAVTETPTVARFDDSNLFDEK